MATDHTNKAGQPLVQSEFKRYLVIAADMSAYNGRSIHGYQLVIVSASSEEDAREFASAALESRGGCLPLAGFTAAELRGLADDLSARELEPRRSFNVSMHMTDAEVADLEKSWN